MAKTFKDSITIVISGEAGQGIQTLEMFLLRLLKENGYFIFSYSEFMSRIRGGNNSTEIRITSEKRSAYVDTIDIFIPLHINAYKRLASRIKPDTVILAKKNEYEHYSCNKCGQNFDFPLSQLVKDAGGKRYENIFILGFIAALFNIEEKELHTILNTYFARKGPEILEKNKMAASFGYHYSEEHFKEKYITINMKQNNSLNHMLLFNGSTSIGLGAIAGGCNFIASYPMSPGTGVLVYLADKAEEYEILVEQAEDEIAAVNMGIAAWYAGARAMATTSGGGFALMAEGLSLAGITESPMVIHIGQRPGPGTGLPTRTEQGDLLFAAFAGHGEFPRIIYAPGTFEEGIRLTQKAFNMADTYQIPVIILTDQYYLDSYGICENITPEENTYSVVTTEESYNRYALDENGISPRGIPSNGTGVVRLDSDEHDESGFITEDFDMRINMNNKRLKKQETFKNDTVEPTLIGSEEYKNLIISWGTTRPVVEEALKNVNKPDTAQLHFSQVYPLPESTLEYINKADKVCIIENNATSQFGKIITMETGIQIEERLLKYNGMPFSVEEIEEYIGESF